MVAILPTTHTYNNIDTNSDHNHKNNTFNDNNAEYAEVIETQPDPQH